MKNKKFIAPTLMVAVFMAGYSVYEPFLAPYLTGKGFSKELVSVIFSAAPFALIVFSSVLGKLSDELGRRKLLIYSLLMIIVSILMYLYLANNVLTLVIATILSAIGLDGYSLTTLQKFEDGIEKERGLLTGVYESISCLGVMLGPLIGTLIVMYLPIEFTFKVTLIILLVLFVIHSREKEGSKGKVNKKQFYFTNNIKEFWQEKSLRGMGILGIATNSTSAGRAVFIPIFYHRNSSWKFGERRHLRFNMGIIPFIAVFFRQALRSKRIQGYCALFGFYLRPGFYANVFC